MSSPPPPSLYADAYRCIFVFLDLPTLAAVASGCKLWLSLLPRLPSIRSQLQWRECIDPFARGYLQRFEAPPLPSYSQSALRHMVTSIDASADSMQLAEVGALKRLQDRLPALECIQLEFFRFQATEFERATAIQQSLVEFPSLRTLQLSWSFLLEGSELTSIVIASQIRALIQFASRFPSLTDLSIHGTSDLNQFYAREAYYSNHSFPSMLTPLLLLPHLTRFEFHLHDESCEPNTRILGKEDVAVIFTMPSLTYLQLQEGRMFENGSAGFLHRLMHSEAAAALRLRIRHLQLSATPTRADQSLARSILTSDLHACCPNLTSFA